MAEVKFDDEVVIDLGLMKFWRFYQMFDPSTAKLLNRNVYQVLCVATITVFLSILIYGAIGIFSNMGGVFNDIDIILNLFTFFTYYLTLFTIVVFLYRSNTVWNLFSVTRRDFLTSKMCHKNINMLYDCREWTKMATTRIMVLQLIVCIPWSIRPFVLNSFDDHPTDTYRKNNIVNIRFPVSDHTHNQYFVFFYLMELFLGLCVLYIIITFDIFIVSFCSVISVKHKVLANSFADVGYENKPQSEHYEDFKSILYDQIQLSLKLKSFYFVIRPIMLIYIGFSSCIIIFLTYSCIAMCLSTGQYSIVVVVNFFTTAIFLCFQLFVFSYLYDSINTNRELVNFGIYSSNWTAMDLKFKKLLLLAMPLNDANQITCTLKATPKKIFNLQLFANVMTTCYNVISVMVKTIHSKQK